MAHPGFHEASSPTPQHLRLRQQRLMLSLRLKLNLLPLRLFFRPRFGQAFRPTTPPQQPPPQPPTAATAALPFRVGNVSSVPSNPSQNTTPPSEKIKPPSPSPSSLTLPPAHVKSTPDPIERNIMLIEKPNPPFKPSNGRLQKDVGDTAKPSSVPDYEKLEKTKDMESKDHKGNHKKAHS